MSTIVRPRTVDAAEPVDVADVPPARGSGAGGGPGSTSVPGKPSGRRPGRRRVDERSLSDRLVMAACAGNAFLVTWLVYARLTDGTGWLGFVLSAYLLFMVLLYVVTREQDGAQAATDRVVEVIIASGAALLIIPFALLILFVITKGAHNLRPGFFTHDQGGVTAEMPATAGGGSHAIVGTLEQVGLALALTLPLSLLTAAFLNETRSPWRRPIRIVVDAMSGVPSIIAGLFIYALFVIPLAKTSTLFNFNGFLACLALSITMLPTITRTVEVVLRLVPDGLRESSLALGSSRARMVWSVVLPTARSGVTTSVVLGIARAVGETAPLLFTSFGFDLMNANPLKDPQESLPLFIFRNIQKPSHSAIDRAYTASFVLMLVVLSLFVVARIIGRDRTRSRRRPVRRPAALEPT